MAARMKSRARYKPSRSKKSSAMVSGYQGASWSQNRGYVYFPNLDTRREVDSYTRTELCRRSRFLYANVGFVKRIIKGIARMALGAGLKPKFRTRDTEWNELAAANFDNRAGSPYTFDLGGRYNYYQAQRALLRARLTDGDVFAVLSKTATNGFAAIRIYEGHCVGNGAGNSENSDTSGWFDGVRVNNNNRALQYRLLNPDGTKAMDINAEQVVPFIDYERSGFNRGVSILSHAINHLLDQTEITGFLKQQVKVSSLVAYQIKNSQRKGGLGASRSVRGRAGDGKPIEQRVEDAIRGAKGLEMENGAELEFVTDNRPHPNTLGFLDYLARDISWGTDFSPEIIWDIHHLSGGPTRFVIADAQEVCDEIQSEVRERFCRRYVNYFNSIEMDSGRLRRCKDPHWWAHDYIAPRKITVDRGRDGKLYIELQGRGMLSLDRWYQEMGQDWKHEMTQFITEKAWVKQKCEEAGLSMDDVFGPGLGFGSINPAETNTVDGDKKKVPDPDDDPDDDAPDPEDT
jgi:capsid protein